MEFIIKTIDELKNIEDDLIFPVILHAAYVPGLAGRRMIDNKLFLKSEVQHLLSLSPTCEIKIICETKFSDFQKELEHLINQYSMEGNSDTPDFILAEYLVDCLKIWNTHIQKREQWYGRKLDKEKYPMEIGE